MMTGSERTTLAEYLARLDEAVDVCDGLRALANTDADQVPIAARAGQGDAAYDQYMRSLFEYLEAKFEYFWFQDQELGAMVRKARPGVEEFSADDFTGFVLTIMYLTQGCRYELVARRPGDLACDDVSMLGGVPTDAPPASALVRAHLTHEPCDRAPLERFLADVCAQATIGYFFTTGRFSNAALEYLGQVAAGPFAERLYVVGPAKLLHLIELSHDICDEIEDLGLIMAVENLDPDEEGVAYAESVEVLRGEAQEILAGPCSADG